LKLYDNRHAPNPRRVRILLADKGIEIPTVQVDLLKREQKSEEFRRRDLAWLDGELAGREFLGGGPFSVADVTALCTLDFATGLVGVEVDPALAELARWHEGVSPRPSARA